VKDGAGRMQPSHVDVVRHRTRAGDRPGRLRPTALLLDTDSADTARRGAELRDLMAASDLGDCNRRLECANGPLHGRHGPLGATQ
jgi:hypothetical protein